MTTQPDIHILLAQSPADIAAVKALFIEYLQYIETYLQQDLSFQGTQKEFTHFPQSYDGIFLARLKGKAVAACAVKPFAPNICELKRLYCTADARGHGLGFKLMQMAINFAKDMDYKQMYLDTDYGLSHANKIYEAHGFRDIDKYYDTPIESRFMAKSLEDAALQSQTNAL